MSVKSLSAASAAPVLKRTSKSSFTFTDLDLLKDPSLAYQLSLAIIAHIDLNAFYSQVEQIRLNLTSEDPVVCAQWQSLIAVSYAARKYGIGRMDSLESALKKCPNLVVAHAAVFKKGNLHWSYVEGLPDQQLHKVLLDPYRRESRKIFKLFRQYCDLVEKASVDECYLDLGRLIYWKLFEIFPCLHQRESELLPTIPEELPPDLLWCGKVFSPDLREERVEGDQGESSESELKVEVEDWDDICMLIGSQLLYEIRCIVYEELEYTTSGGLGKNKSVAKLASGYLKPDNQTIVRNSSRKQFFRNFDITDFSGMGGKTGELVVKKLRIPEGQNSINFVLDNFSLNELKICLDHDLPLAHRVFELVRGELKQEMSLRTEVKSMMSRKNFSRNNHVTTVGDAYEWMQVFVGDIYNRLIELDDENMNVLRLQLKNSSIWRPRTVSVQLFSFPDNKLSRQAPLPYQRSLSRFNETLGSLAFKLILDLLEVPSSIKDCFPNDILPEVYHYKILPLANISVTVTNFMKTKESSLIDNYLTLSLGEVPTTQGGLNREHKIQDNALEKPFDFKLGQAAFAKSNHFSSEAENSQAGVVLDTPFRKQREIKRPDGEEKAYIDSLFRKFETENPKERSSNPKHVALSMRGESSLQDKHLTSLNSSSVSLGGPLRDTYKNNYCPICEDLVENTIEHKDFHIALDFSKKLNGEKQQDTFLSRSSRDKKSREKPLKKTKTTKGQSRLPF